MEHVTEKMKKKKKKRREKKNLKPHLDSIERKHVAPEIHEINGVTKSISHLEMKIVMEVTNKIPDERRHARLDPTNRKSEPLLSIGQV